MIWWPHKTFGLGVRISEEMMEEMKRYPLYQVKKEMLMDPTKNTAPQEPILPKDLLKDLQGEDRSGYWCSKVRSQGLTQVAAGPSSVLTNNGVTYYYAGLGATVDGGIR